MYLSKFWFFLVTVIAVTAITIALVMPRPAERAALKQEDKTVRNACLVTNILLRDNARARIQQTSEFAQAVRELPLSQILFDTAKDEAVSVETNGIGRKELTKLLERASEPKPNFIWLLDNKGRVIARSNLEDKTFGDSMRGYYVVQDALDGYIRDDLWMMKDGLYRVSAAPVLTRKLKWAGAIVLGQRMDKEFATTLSKNIDAHINFYVAGDSVASSNPVQIHKDVVVGSEELAEIEEGLDCASSTILHIKAGDDRYAVVNARLPGEAGEQGAFYSVFIKQAVALDFMGMIDASNKDDLGFDRFPWIFVGLLFVGLMTIGFLLMHREVDSPLKKLGADAVAMAKGSQDRFQEDVHRGKYGSIARSVNISIEKSQREAKAAKKDLDQLLGPAPEQGYDAAASALPPIDDAPVPPPPGDFKFGGAAASKPAPSAIKPMPGMTAAVPTPTPKAAGFGGKTPPPPLPPSSGIASLKSATHNQVVPDPVTMPGDLFGSAPPIDDDDLPTVLNEEPVTSYFQQVYEEFIALKKKCGEPTENLTFERFSKKLQANQDTLIAKHNCNTVKFQVYAKDGKAALKASPVK